MRRISLLLCLLVFCAAAVMPGDKKDAKSRTKELPPDTLVIRHNTPPVMIKEKEPEYPRLAKEAGFSGKVIIKAYVNEKGEVESARGVACNRPNMGFEEAAVGAAYKSVFEPAKLKDKPVSVWIKYSISFDPEKGARRGAINSFDLK